MGRMLSKSLSYSNFISWYNFRISKNVYAYIFDLIVFYSRILIRDAVCDCCIRITYFPYEYFSHTHSLTYLSYSIGYSRIVPISKCSQEYFLYNVQSVSSTMYLSISILIFFAFTWHDNLVR